MFPSLFSKVGHLAKLRVASVQILNSGYSTMIETQPLRRNTEKALPSLEGQCDDLAQGPGRNRIGDNISRKDKLNFLINTLLDLRDSKEAVYGTLDAWVAWEQNFPIVSIKRALIALEKEQQWHRVVQVIKWMLSKGQGNTMGIYRQLIRALDMDHRAEEAEMFWQKKIGTDLHSVPWQLCKIMTSMYYRNNMLENLIKLFKALEAFDRKPPEKSIVQKVADAYEILGLPEEKERVLDKYRDIFSETDKGWKKKSRNASPKKKKKSGKAELESTTNAVIKAVDDKR